jgi:hypothetical protein
LRYISLTTSTGYFFLFPEFINAGLQILSSIKICKMKIKVLVAFIATATIIFLSCNWFRSKKKEASNPLIGEWKLDSVGFPRDSNFTNFFLAGMSKPDSVEVSFTKDTVFTRTKDHVDTAGYAFDAKTNQLTTKDSSQTFTFVKVNDSLISLTTKDSTILFLQKK